TSSARDSHGSDRRGKHSAQQAYGDRAHLHLRDRALQREEHFGAHRYLAGHLRQGFDRRGDRPPQGDDRQRRLPGRGRSPAGALAGREASDGDRRLPWRPPPARPARARPAHEDERSGPQGPAARPDRAEEKDRRQEVTELVTDATAKDSEKGNEAPS